MDSQELRNLQEAYLEVVENQQQINEATDDPIDVPFKPKRLPNGRIPKPTPQEVSATAAALKLRARARKGMGEEVDIYDIILSHLLDEGYAETEEAAEAIMANMSEDWKDIIIEARVDTGKTDREKADARWQRGTGGPVMHHISRGFRNKKGSPSGGVDRLGKPEGIPLDMQRQKREAAKDRKNVEYNNRQRVQSRGTWDRD